MLNSSGSGTNINGVNNGVLALSGIAVANGAQMTSKDYYFDSYAHFGIHEASFFLKISAIMIIFLYILKYINV